MLKNCGNLEFDVVAVPGPCALVAALSISGLATDSFSFYGFLPSKSSQRKTRLKELMGQTPTLIFYESSHRIKDCMQDIAELDDKRHIVIAREITKTFETVLSGNASAIVDIMEQDDNQQKGEFVVMIEGNIDIASELSESDKVWLEALLDVLPDSKASQLVAKVTGLKKKVVYNYVQSLK